MIERRIRTAGAHVRRAALVALIVLAASARAAVEPPEDTARAVPDSAKHVFGKAGSMQRILSEADSVVKAQGGPNAGDAQLFLSWSAPWGDRRARQARQPACADSGKEDTLFLSFVPGRTVKQFTGFTAQVHVRATGADTLGPWWHMESKGGENAGSLRVEWAATPGFGWRQPFRVPGQGFALLDHTPAVARLRLVFAVPYEGAGPIAPDSIYALCRVILKHRPARGLAGCDRPVCVEWSAATLAFGPKDEPEVHRGERFVAFGGPWSICEPFKGPHVEAWKPPKPAPAKSGTK